MSKLADEFQAAVAASRSLKEQPDNGTLLKLYSLYKQGSAGDVEGKRPGFTDPIGRAKYDAWASMKGTKPEDAMRRYVELITALKG